MWIHFPKSAMNKSGESVSMFTESPSTDTKCHNEVNVSNSASRIIERILRCWILRDSPGILGATFVNTIQQQCLKIQTTILIGIDR